MDTYTITLAMEQESKQYFKGHSYTLYLFKGMNAGSGAISAIWKTVSGDELLDEDPIQIQWTDDFYLGRTANSRKHLTTITETNPFGQTGERRVQLGNCYRHEGRGWNAATSPAPGHEFRVVNAASQSSVFYASQNGETDFAVLQKARPNGGLVTFEPLDTVAMLVATNSYEVGTLVNEAFTSGAIVTLPPGTTKSQVDYDIFRGWRGPHVSMLRHSRPIHDQMVQMTRITPPDDR